MSREIKPLTSLRAIAAAMVFFYHFVYLRNPVPVTTLWQAVLENGFVGVSIFFVLSGFVLALRYYGDVQDSRFHWGDYLKRRAVRILPLYFFLLPAIALIHIPVNITNVTLTQGFFVRYIETGLTASWTLTVEGCFYLLLPFVLAVIVRFRNPLIAAIILLLWSGIMLGVGMALVEWSHNSGMAQQTGFMGTADFMLHRTLFGYIFDFSVGIFAAILYKRYGSQKASVSTLMIIGGTAGVLGCMWLMHIYQQEITLRSLMYGVSAFAGLLVFGLTNADTFAAKALSWSPLVYMGRISYALYLLQLTQLVWFMSNWNVIIFYVGTNILSAGIYQFVEEPARRLIMNGTLRRHSPVLHGEYRS